MPSPRGAGAAAAMQGGEDYSDDSTRAPAALQDGCEDLMPAAVYAARVLEQLRNVVDNTSRRIWLVEYSLCERVIWPRARR